MDLQTFKRNKELATWVREQYTKMHSDQLRARQTWYMNMAFYDSQQWSELNPTTNKLYQRKVPPFRVRHTANIVEPIVRTEIARITAQKPSASVVPASSDDDDLMAAHAAEQLWESLCSTRKLKKKFNSAAYWTVITGNGFIKTFWDTTTADMASTYASTNPMFGPGNPIMGDICYRVISPFHLFVPDLTTEDIQDQGFVFTVYTYPVETVKMLFPGQDITPDTLAANQVMDEAFTVSNRGGKQAKPDCVLVIEAWVKPGQTSLLPTGGQVIVANDKVLYTGDMYEHGQFPFAHFKHIPTGKFYAKSVVSTIIPLQREYNRTRSQIIEAKNRMARPQLLAAKGSIDASRLTNAPGLVIEYVPGLPAPTPLPLQPLPAYVINELQQVRADMEDISGQHQVSSGGAPPGVTAATAISFLQEKDDSLLTTVYQSVEDGFEDIAKQSIGLAIQYYDVPRLIKTNGSDYSFDTLMLKGSDIKSGTDIRMEGGSALPTSKAARQAFILDLMSRGFIDPQNGLKLLDMGGTAKLWEDLKIDESQAQRENMRMKVLTAEDVAAHQDQWGQYQQQADAQMQQTGSLDSSNPVADPNSQMMMAPGPIVPVNTWDNHDVHITEHNKFRKTQAFEGLSNTVKQEFELHVNTHLQAVQAAMQEVQGVMAQQAMSGGGMPPGMPGTPGTTSSSVATGQTDPGIGGPPNG